MSTIECELAESLIRPVSEPPLLSIVIPTFERTEEMTVAVASIAHQVDDALAGKVEIIVADNGSGGPKPARLRELAAAYPSVSYMIHAENQGGDFQIYASPFRARGRWTWIFGDDDALGDNALGEIVGVLETEAPAFLTINRQVWDKDLSRMLGASKHAVASRRFETFNDLLGVFGFDQLSFITSQIYLTEPARGVDFAPYRKSVCRYSQLAYYIEAFHDLPAYYLATPHVRHRWDSDDRSVAAANFQHLATYLPEMVQFAADRAGIPEGYFERISGRRSLLAADERRITFIDNILENLWRSVAMGTVISVEEWAILAGVSAGWGDERREQLQVVQDFHDKVSEGFGHLEALIAEHGQRVAAGLVRTGEEIALLRRIESAAPTLEKDLNEARKTALQLSMGFH